MGWKRMGMVGKGRDRRMLMLLGELLGRYLGGSVGDEERWGW